MTKIAVVTGAAGGLGRAKSAKLRADGFHVGGLDLDREGLDEMSLGETLPV